MLSPMNTLYGPPSETLALLIHDRDSHDFLDPVILLSDITPEEAFKYVGLPYTLADVLAHANANLVFNIHLLRDKQHDELNLWPKIEMPQWESLKADFLKHLAILENLAHTMNLNQVVFAATATEPAWTVGCKLAASVAKHTAYHLGQIALFKRLVKL